MFPNILKNNLEHSEHHSEYQISDSGYGKDHVKILHVHRHHNVHTINEFEVNTHLKLYSKKDYIHGDNSDIIATDSQKNTVYLLAKKHGIKNPETFGQLLAEHFLHTYRHVKEVHIHVQEYPWKRIKYDNHEGRRESAHDHAFIFKPVAIRFCDVFLKRHDRKPIIISGLKDLRVLKTTQSSFYNFIDDEYRSLPDTKDRLFSTNIRSCWQYSTIDHIDFDKIWHKVQNIILESFAGPYKHGINSPSVQNTIYIAEKHILDAIKEIDVINIEMPNIHYFIFDTTKYPKVVEGENKEVYHPTDKPSGIIFAQLSRKELSSKL